MALGTTRWEDGRVHGFPSVDYAASSGAPRARTWNRRFWRPVPYVETPVLAFGCPRSLKRRPKKRSALETERLTAGVRRGPRFLAGNRAALDCRE